MIAKTAGQMINVMQASLKGKPIECRPYRDVPWKEVIVPSWNWEDYDYRVKPQIREFWVRQHESGSVMGRMSLLESASELGKGWGPIFKVREVVEGDEA